MYCMTQMVRQISASLLFPLCSMVCAETLNSLAFDDLFASVTFLLRNSPGSIFITSYHKRRYFLIHLIFGLMMRIHLSFTICFDSFLYLLIRLPNNVQWGSPDVKMGLEVCETS
ncbi:hypothetical protein L6164_020199 [Bauhinia variegata]|uniref:Uncharacterized protein n=1 Tax=Bauhinia variegata TaxID=167791 RepID=A0ACB9MUD2_BAUVA|nr:hypothetical protein L6164_020199 [Bauhinia variegata]